MATTTVRTTLRLLEELDRALVDYCAETGATKNRAVAIALRSWLGDDAPRAPAQPPDDDALAREFLVARGGGAGEAALARALVEELDAREVGP